MNGVARKYSAFAAAVLVLGLLQPVSAQSLLTTIAVDEAQERMAITPDGSRIYAVGAMNNNVTVIDTQLDSVLKVITRSGERKDGGDWPDDIVVSNDGARVYVVSGALDRLTAIDRASNTSVAEVTVGNNPSSLAVTPDGKKLYVANAGFPGMGVAVIDTTSFAKVASIPVFPTALARTMVVHPDGSRVYLASMMGVSVINTATDTVVASIPANGWRMAMSPDGSRLYVHSQFASRIDVVDTATNAIIASIPAPGSGPDPEVIIVTPDGKRVYATHFSGSRVSVIDTATNTVVANLPFSSSFPVGLAASPESSTAFVTTPTSLSWFKTTDNSLVATLPVSVHFKGGETPIVTPDSTKLYLACGQVCVFGTGIVTLRTVTIDIKPGDTPNSINAKGHGVIAVALLADANLDVKDVDTATIRFGAKGTEATARQVAWADVNADGKTDLVFHFETRDTDLKCGDTEAVLTGAMLDGQKLRGADSVRTVGCR